MRQPKWIGSQLEMEAVCRPPPPSFEASRGSGLLQRWIGRPFRRGESEPRKTHGKARVGRAPSIPLFAPDTRYRSEALGTGGASAGSARATCPCLWSPALCWPHSRPVDSRFFVAVGKMIAPIDMDLDLRYDEARSRPRTHTLGGDLPWAATPYLPRTPWGSSRPRARCPAHAPCARPWVAGRLLPGCARKNALRDAHAGGLWGDADPSSPLGPLSPTVCLCLHQGLLDLVQLLRSLQCPRPSGVFLAISVLSLLLSRHRCAFRITQLHLLVFRDLFRSLGAFVITRIPHLRPLLPLMLMRPP